MLMVLLLAAMTGGICYKATARVSWLPHLSSEPPSHFMRGHAVLTMHHAWRCLLNLVPFLAQTDHTCPCPCSCFSPLAPTPTPHPLAPFLLFLFSFDTYQQIRVHRLTRTLSCNPGETVQHSGSLLSHLADLDLLDSDPSLPSALAVRLARSPLWQFTTDACKDAMVRVASAQQRGRTRHSGPAAHRRLAGGSGGSADSIRLQRRSSPSTDVFPKANLASDSDDADDADGDDDELDVDEVIAAQGREPTRHKKQATPSSPPPPQAAAAAAPLFSPGLCQQRAARSHAAAVVRNPLLASNMSQPGSPAQRRISRSKSFSVRASANDLRVVGQVVDQTPHDGELPEWADTSRFESLSLVLHAMAMQVTEGFASRQFELRRMAVTVLPLLTEVMRWFDPATLHDFWLAFPPTDVSWLSHVSTLSFKQSLAHAAWLRSFSDSQALGAWGGGE